MAQAFSEGFLGKMDDIKSTQKDSPDVCSEPAHENVSCVPCGPAEPRQESSEPIEEANAAFYCRFCLHATDNVDELISPCHCIGNASRLYLGRDLAFHVVAGVVLSLACCR